MTGQLIVFPEKHMGWSRIRRILKPLNKLMGCLVSLYESTGLIPLSYFWFGNYQKQ